MLPSPPSDSSIASVQARSSKTNRTTPSGVTPSWLGSKCRRTSAIKGSSLAPSPILRKTSANPMGLSFGVTPTDGTNPPSELIAAAARGRTPSRIGIRITRPHSRCAYGDILSLAQTVSHFCSACTPLLMLPSARAKLFRMPLGPGSAFTLAKNSRRRTALVFGSLALRASIFAKAKAILKFSSSVSGTAAATRLATWLAVSSVPGAFCLPSRIPQAYLSWRVR